MGSTTNTANQRFDLNIFDNLQEEVVVYEIMHDMLDEIADLRVEYVNDASIKGFMAEEDVIGKTATELYDKDIAALHLKMANNVLKSGEGKKYNAYLEPVNKYYSVSAYSPDNNMYITISTDISEHKKSGEALKEGKEFYKTFFNNPLNAFALCEIIIDDKGEPADFVHLKVNNAFEDITGLKKEEVLNKKVIDIIPVEEVAPAIEICGKVALTGKSEQFEINIPSLDKIYNVAAFSPRKKQFIAVFTDITEQKKTEQELQKQADLLNLTNDAIIVRDMGDRIVFWNRGAEERYGWTKEEAYGKVTHNLLKNEFPVPLAKIFNQLFQKGYWEGELTQTRRNGTKIIVSSRWALQKNENNEPIGFMEINTDITEHKKVDEAFKQEVLVASQNAKALEESEKKFREVFNNANDVLFLNKLKKNGMPGQFIEVNNVACNRLGYTRDEFLKMSLEDIDDPKDAIILPSIMEEIYKKGHVTFEMVHISKKGVKIPVEISSHIFILNGEKVILSIARDITERKKVEKSLKESESKLRAIIEYSPDVIAVTDLIGNLIHCNGVGLDIFGFTSKEEATEFNTFDLIAPEDQARAMQNMKKMFSEGYVKDVEYNLLTKNGHIFPAELSVGVLLDDDKPNAFICVVKDITERKKTEKSLKEAHDTLEAKVEERTAELEKAYNSLDESDKRLKVAMDMAKLVHWEYDVESDVFTFDDQFYALYGTTTEQEGGSRMSSKEYATKFIPSDEWSIVAEETAKALETDDPNYSGQLEHNIIMADGEKRCILVRYEVIKDNKGRNIKTHGTNQDITERKKIEETLQFQADILKNVRDCVIVYDLQGKISYWNKGAESVYGYLEKEVIGKNIKTLYWDRDKNKFPSDLREITESGEYIGEWEGKRKDGSKVYVDIRETVMYDLNGEIVGIIGVSKDITERKESDKALKYSEKHLRMITNNMVDMVSQTDINGVIQYISPSGKTLIGYEPEEIIGNTIFDYVHSDDLEEVKKGVQNAFITMTPKLMEVRFKHAEGHYVWLEIAGNLFFDKKQLKGAVFGSRDVSKRKKAEGQLKELVEELRRSNEELQRFAYVASHDLQEPLRTIASFTQLLERRYKGKFDDDADEFIYYIVEAALRMKEQIQGLLEYSRVATNVGEFQPVNINSVLNKTIDSLKVSTTECSAEITHDKLPTVLGDDGQLQRVFQNLISNALKFRRENEPPKIHVSSVKDKENKEYIFSVSDNGIGIEKQYMGRIFVIFQRLHTRDEYHGTGIGLSIVKKIIERHNGRIWVESKPDVGSTFHFTLPF